MSLESLNLHFKNSIMKLRKTLLLLPIAIALATPVAAVQINWGNEIDSDLRDSFGNSLDATFAIQLGYFEKVLGQQFVPTAANTGEWSSHWKVFDQAAFDPLAGYFTSSANLNPEGTSSSTFADNDLGVDFSNQNAYVWIHNSQTPGTGTEWFLGRSATTPAWQIPAKVEDCCDNRPPVEWSITDLEPADAPVFGKQGGTSGAGDYSVTGPYTLQTFSVVPEPSSCLLLTLGGAAVILRRRRPQS